MPKTSRPVQVHPGSLRELQVVRITDVTPGMRRVTLGGAQLGAFTSVEGHPQPAFVSPSFDDDIRLFFTAPGRSTPVLPVQHAGYLERPAQPAAGRVYTVRRWDPERGELDVDFVRHGMGIATTWATRARPGDPIHLIGPNRSKGFPHDADWLLVAGDDTALPAIGRLLAELDPDARAQVFVEIAEHAHRQPLRELPGVSVTWVVRDGATAGTTTGLLDAVRGVTWWPGRPFAWVAGEQAVVRDLRRHLVEDRELPRESVEFTGYWRRAEVVALASDVAVPDPARNTPAFERFHDLVELIPPIALRVAAELGIGDLISRGSTTGPQLAARTGTDERALGKLLRYLCTIDVLTETDGRYALSEVGEFLADEFWTDALRPTGVLGSQSLGIFGLAESIRTGGPAYASVTGRSFADLRTDQAYEDRFLDRVAGFQPMLAGPIAASDLLAGVGHLVIHSGGAGAQAREFTAAHPELRVTICALPAQADWLRRDLPATIPDEHQRARVAVVEQSVFEPTPAADAVAVLRALDGLPDADAAHALRRAAENLAAGGRVLLVEEAFDTEAMDEHDGETDLLALTRLGGGLRTDAELRAVIERAGLTLAATRTVGWGTQVHELVRPSPQTHIEGHST